MSVTKTKQNQSRTDEYFSNSFTFFSKKDKQLNKKVLRSPLEVQGKQKHERTLNSRLNDLPPTPRSPRWTLVCVYG